MGLEGVQARVQTRTSKGCKRVIKAIEKDFEYKLSANVRNLLLYVLVISLVLRENRTVFTTISARLR